MIKNPKTYCNLCRGILFDFEVTHSHKAWTKDSKNVTAAIDRSNDGLFIISDKSEKELIDEYGGQSYIIPLGIILSAVGFSMILTSLGYI